MALSEQKKQLSARLFSRSLPTVQDIEARYPRRDLPATAMVTRIAPSPTGFMHVGTLYTAMISERLAHQSGGVFFLRVEDTDKKREVEGAVDLIVQAFEEYDVRVDEGMTKQGERGSYGPYTQSARADLYQAFVKDLFERDLAYPCFCTAEELEEAHRVQELQKVRTGYYGAFATCRAHSDEAVLRLLDEGKAFVMRFKSPGMFDKRITIEDVLIGTRELPENDLDIVILKSDGLPTYHFAHLIDDHYMGTTHVVRGDEWYSSLPLHVQLYRAMGWEPPMYGHLAPIQKLDEGKKRKLSKRKDPEASVAFFEEQGYTKEGLTEYLLNLANSNFEDWRKEHPTEDNRTFVLSFEKLANSAGALFDFDKLNDISKELISRFSAEQVFDSSLQWAKKHDQELAHMMEKNSEYTKQIFGIERGMGEKVRKDLAKWSDVREQVWYFYDETFQALSDEHIQQAVNLKLEDVRTIVAAYSAQQDFSDSKDAWLEKLRALCTSLGYAENVKAFKQQPEQYKGSIVDVTKVLRVLLTGKTQTPDLYSLIHVMGKERVESRLKRFS